MEIISEFGFVTGGHKACMYLAQASLASMRHFCPDIPIALLVDGDFDVSHLVRLYDVIPLRVDEVPDSGMRKLVARSYHAKLVPMWEGPFEYFVWFDADAIAWGDFTPYVRRDVDFHIFRPEKDEVVPLGSQIVPAWMKHFFFDPCKIEKFDPQFRWQGNKYFCPGAFAAKRNSIPFEEYEKAMAWEKANSGTFSWGEMGMLNYLVYSRAQRGLLKFEISDLQDMWSNNGREELVADCNGVGWHFPKTIARPRVAHFCGRKPHLFDRKSYSHPFTIARLEHYRKINGNLGAWARVLYEEFQIISRKAASKISRRLSSS